MSDRTAEMRGTRASWGRAAAVALLAVVGAWAGRADAAVALGAGGWTQIQALAGNNPSGTKNADSGTNRLLVVVLAGTGSAGTAPTCTGTYGNSNLTQAVASPGTQTRKSCILTLNESGIAAAGGSALTVIMNAGTVSNAQAWAAFYTGVNQTTPVSASTANASANNVVAYPSALTANASGAVVVGVAGSASSTATSVASSATLAYTQRAFNASNVAIAVWDRIVGGAAESDTVTHTFASSTSSSALVAIAMNPAASNTITVADGTDPTNTATSGQAAAIDAFTLQTNTGTASVSGVTVTLTNPSALTSAFLYSAASCTGGTQYGTAATPAASITFSGLTTLSATTTATTYYVCGTAGTVASSTAVTAVVASATTGTSGYTVKASTDTAGTLTVVPQSISIATGTDPTNAAFGGTTAAIDSFKLQTNINSATVNAVTVTLTNPTALTGVFLYSAAACTGGTQYGTTATPAASVTFSTLTVPATTTATPFYVCGTAANVSSSTPVTAVVASATTSTANYVVNASADTAGTLTVNPKTVSIATGTDPANTVLAGQTAAIDAFTLQANTGSATVSAVTVTLTNSSALTGVFLYSAAACTGGTQYGTTATPAASVTFGTLTVPATTTATTFYVCGTAGTVASSTAVTAGVASATTSTTGYSVAASADAAGTLTVNPKMISIASGTDPTNSVTAGGTAAIDAFTLAANTGTATVSGITLTLTNPTALTGVFLYSTAACTGGTQYGSTATPAASVTFSTLSVPATNTATAFYVCGTAGTVSSSTAITAVVASATTSTAGYVVNASADTAGTLTVTPPPVPGTTTGAITATVNSCGQVSVAAGYTGDTDGDNTVTFSRSTDGTTFTNLTACTSVGGGANPRTCVDTTVAASTSYWYRALFADTTGGVSGTTSITTASSVNTGACAASLVLGNPGGQPLAGSITVGAASWTYVGQFTLAASSGTVTLGSIAIANGAVTPLATGGDLQVNLVNSTGTGVYSTGSWDGSRWVFGSIVDPATGLPVSITTTAVTFRVHVTANYGAAAAENFAMQVNPVNVIGLSPAAATIGATFTASTFTTAAPAVVNEGSASSTTGPMVSIVNPEKGKAVSGNFLVQIYVYSANASAISAMGLAADGSTPACAGNDASITKDSHTYTNASAAMYSKLVSGLAAGTYTLKACAANGAGTLVSPPVTITVRAAGSGDGNLLVRDNATQLCSDCHDRNKLQPHDSQATQSKYGSWSTSCRDCHTPHSTRNLYLVKEQIVPPAVNGYQAGKNVYLATKTGDSNVSGATTPASSSFANSDGSGVCQVCHTRTMNPARTFNNATYTSASPTVTTSSNVFVTGTTPTGDVGNWIFAPDGRSYQISAVVSATQATLATTYQGATASAAKLIVGPSRWRNVGNGDTHYTAAAGTSACTGCHSHKGGFAAGESTGGANCSSCHSTIWQGMNGAVTKTTKHTLGNALGTNDAFTDSGIAWANPLSTNAAAARSCVNMCHGDHPHDLTSPVTATHENNVYVDATTSTARADGSASRIGAGGTGTVNRYKTDYDGTQANGGLCASCHQNPVDASHPAIVKASFDVSAHDYTANTVGANTYTWQYTLHSGAFVRDCTKCHASNAEGTTPTVGASGSATVAVHFSDSNPSLLSGKVNPGGTAAGFVCYNCHGTTATPASGAQGNRSNKDIQSQIAHATTAGQSGHPSNGDTVHNSVTEYGNAAFGNTLGVTGRHANCIDCHEPHQAKAGVHTTQTNLAGNALQGAWGAQLSTNPAFWAAPTSANFTKKVIAAGTDLEATLCFKCHTAYYGTLPTTPSGTFTETDTAREFNPANAGNWSPTWSSTKTAGSFHPVLAAATGNLGLTNNILAPWTTSSTMTCSDCHASDVTTDPSGPHGSAAKFILKGPNTKWDATLQNNNGMPAGTFCANCHAANFASGRGTSAPHTNGQHNGSSGYCFMCHVAIPHGSMRPGLLSAQHGSTWDGILVTDKAPYNQSPTTQGLGLGSYPGTQATAWAKNNCGCGSASAGH